jgi:hypothetical protein
MKQALSLAGMQLVGLQADVGEIVRTQSGEQRQLAQTQDSALRFPVWSMRIILKLRYAVVNRLDRAQCWSCKPGQHCPHLGKCKP